MENVLNVVLFWVGASVIAFVVNLAVWMKSVWNAQALEQQNLDYRSELDTARFYLRLAQVGLIFGPPVLGVLITAGIIVTLRDTFFAVLPGYDWYIERIKKIDQNILP